jgi:hypothetical protein
MHHSPKVGDPPLIDLLHGGDHHHGYNAGSSGGVDARAVKDRLTPSICGGDARSAAIAEAKMNLNFEQAFVRGILCNALVCIAVWMILAARTIPSKLAGLIFPISAFITLGFEHSIANFYLLPAGLLAGAAGSLGAAVTNLVAVTLGNLVGGIVVALAFWMTYLRGTGSEPARSTRFSLRSRRTKQVPLSW